jgi:cytochrome c oxidase subunit 2
MPKSANDRRHFIIVGVLVAISTVVLYWLLDAALPLPVQASIEALTIDTLIGWHLWIIAFLFSLVVVFMIYSFVVFRRREGDESEGEHFEGNTTLEIVWTALPLALVVIFSFYGISTLNEVTKVEDNEVVIKVVGRQWSWAFEYENGLQSAELVLPVNRNIYMDMLAADVNHAFWIQEFRVKQDLLAGQQTHVRFTPTMTSEEYMASEGKQFILRCAELCGLQHHSMMVPVQVVPEDQYLAWLDEQVVQENQAVAQSTDGN